jgi:hypothetical protein
MNSGARCQALGVGPRAQGIGHQAKDFILSFLKKRCGCGLLFDAKFLLDPA